ncbi:MAG: isoaspartyl peptidase/L-asparaginase [Deltaproteobacteria bacterium]|nr:isoaspartyl peptidase/L-asparaginase [Deltaproteobacteria bacterium]
MTTEERETAPGLTGSDGGGPSRFTILVHGGAGDVHPSFVASHVAGCERAAREGAKILAAGGTALDAVQRAVEVLESDPLFNAGTGACLDADGHLALDASIMDGRDLRAGAVCALPAFEHPIAIARAVMDASEHVLLAAEGAARFAESQGFARADEATMITDASRRKLEAAKKKHRAESWAGGTVGAVAKDMHGHVAAATSTGGMVNKLPGRVGDSPLIGAGTYADDLAGACSTTGHGEAMIRVCLAKTVVDGVRAHAAHTSAAARASVTDGLAMMLTRTALTGGAIVVAPDGSFALARSTRTMTWASVQDPSDARSGS